MAEQAPGIREYTAPATAGGSPPRGFLSDAGQVLGLFTVSAVALVLIFPPLGSWPLAFVALVPWALGVCRAQRAWLVHWLSFFVGWGFFLVALRWLQPVTGLGYAALGLYLAFYWTLAAWALRTGRRHGISVVWTLPVAWVACEYLRAIVMTGFPWLFLAHGLHAQLPLIQIADLVGAYGVSFVAALVNGLLVELALRRWPAPTGRRPRRELWLAAGVTVAAVGGTLWYGFYRLREVDFTDAARRGPRIAVVQEDFPLRSKPPYGEHPYVLLARHLALGAQAALQRPDLVAFPETAWNSTQNVDYLEQKQLIPEARPESRDFSAIAHKATSAFARGDYATVNAIIADLEAALRTRSAARSGRQPAQALPRLPETGGPPVTVLVGAVSIEQFPTNTYPKVNVYNSALVYDPDGTQRPVRYDKHHLVPFGEIVPFRQKRWLGLDLHWLYRWLNSLSPFSDGGQFEYSLTPGTTLTVFDLPTAAGRTFRFGVPICYEDATPYVVRGFVWNGRQRRADFLINISNDGWFQHSSELPQHLAICAFRAVENRVSIARAVNTGISGFIDPNGRIFALVTDEEGRAFRRGVGGIVGYSVADMPLDTRGSLYGRAGDWFAQVCTLLTAVLWLGAIFERWVLALKARLAAWFGKGAT